MVPLKTRRKLKELGSIGLSRNKIARLMDISPSALSRFLSGERSGLNIAAKVLTFIIGTNRLGEFKVNGTSGEIIAIKEHPTKGKVKIYSALPPDEDKMYQEVNSEVEKTLKDPRSIQEIPDKLKALSKQLSEKYQNKIQIPYWIGLYLFKVYQSSNGSNPNKERRNISLCCSTRQQKLIVLNSIREIIKELLMKVDFEEISFKEVDYRMQAMNLDGFIYLYEDKLIEASKSFFKGIQLGINWLGLQKEISENQSCIVWKSLLGFALNNLNNALYSYDFKLIADSRCLFLLLDKDFCIPENIVGKAVIEKVLEIMKEHKDNNLSSDPESAPFNCFFRNYAGFKRYFVERSSSKKEVVLV